jgi:hypothetical protein
MVLIVVLVTIVQAMQSLLIVSHRLSIIPLHLLEITHLTARTMVPVAMRETLTMTTHLSLPGSSGGPLLRRHETTATTQLVLRFVLLVITIVTTE